MADPPAPSRVSAGILLFRRTANKLEVLLGHPGGPYFADRDRGVWSIPKGEVQPGEELLAVALREFGEETGHVVGTGNLLPLGSVRQRGGQEGDARAVGGGPGPSGACDNGARPEDARERPGDGRSVVSRRRNRARPGHLLLCASWSRPVL